MASEDNLVNQEIEFDDTSPTNADVDDDGEDSLRIRRNDNFLAKASMTESYSEILNSPTAETSELPGQVESNAPIVIPKRRPTSLTRHHSSQCMYRTFSLDQ